MSNQAEQTANDGSTESQMNEPKDEPVGQQDTTEDLEGFTPVERDKLAESRVRQYALASMAAGLVPLPLVDLAAVFSIQLKLLHSLARIYGMAFRADLARSAIASLIGGALPVATAPSIASSLGKLIPGVGQTLATGSLVVLNGAATYALGKVFIQHFASGGTLLSFDPESVRSYFEEQLREGRTAVDELRTQRPSSNSKARAR